MNFRTVRKMGIFCAMVSLFGGAAAGQALAGEKTLVVTASNATQNQLLVYTADGKLVQTISTHGQGGASGNAGGIEVKDDLLAVVNFGSRSVSLFKRGDEGFYLKELVYTASSPLSVAFGHDHLYVLGTTTIESHRMFGSDASYGPDGVATLLKADGSSAQVGVLPKHLVITEKSNTIETVGLTDDGAVTGLPKLAMNIPTNVNAPFGLVTRGNDAYVTIAHANEISLVRKGDVLTVTGSGTQMAPCWVALEGPFLFSSNSPSMTISRYAVYGQKIVQDAAVVATLNGDPTDIAYADKMIAVIDGSGTVTHLSIFTVDEDGNLTLVKANTITGAANGVAVVRGDD
jgi:hypothetical protein